MTPEKCRELEEKVRALDSTFDKVNEGLPELEKKIQELEKKARWNCPVDPKPVELNNRYAGAWGEIAQRIAQRQVILTWFTTIMLAIVGKAYISPVGDTFRILYLVGPLSLAMVWLLRMHELQIAYLRVYLAKLEEADEGMNLQGVPFPRYHWEKVMSKWTKGAQEARKIHDRVVCGLILGILIVSWYVLCREVAKDWPQSFPAGWGGCVCGFKDVGRIADFVLSIGSSIFGVIALFLVSGNGHARDDAFNEAGRE